jgi:exodeoxyribonuclease V alpha subunit
MHLGTAEVKSPPFSRDLLQTVRGSDLGEESLYLAWELTRQVQKVTPQQQEALLVTILASLINLRLGSTCMPIGQEEGIPYLRELFDSLDAKPELVQVAIEILNQVGQANEEYVGHEILGGPGDYKPLIVEGDFLYHQRLLDQENRVAESLGQHFALSPKVRDESQIESAVQDVLQHPTVSGERPIQLSAEQQKAIQTAMRRSIAAISGGPGTGKTSVVVFILRVLARLGVKMESVALAAPTGKAANRMEESVQKGLLAIPNRSGIDDEILEHLPGARTLHRLLGYSPKMGGFRHHEKNPLSHEVVIIDEASMIDLELMDRLLRAAPKDARLIFLGDADQLPSVNAGAIFRDLLPPKEGTADGDPRKDASIVLTESYRMDPSDPAGRNILKVAAKINAGQGESLFDPNFPQEETITERASADELTFHGVELLAEGNKTQKKNAFLERWFNDRVRSPRWEELIQREYFYEKEGFDNTENEVLQELFEHSNNHKILCATTRDAEYANSFLHQRMAALEQRRGRIRAIKPRFRSGEPIMMLRNDYERGLFNGDQGLVLRIFTGSGQARTMAVFPQKESFSAFALDSLGADIALSFAMTVHKSQGSEFDNVGCMLPDRDMPLLTCEVIYTAVTRCRSSVVLLCTRALLYRSVNRQGERFSGVFGPSAQR